MKDQFTLNEPLIILILTISIYGILGVATPEISSISKGLLNPIYFSLPLVMYIISLYLLREDKYEKISIDLPNIRSSHIFLFTFFLILSIFIFSIINESLSGDSLYYAQYGFVHSFTILPFIYLFLPSLIELDVSLLMRAFSLIILLGLGILFFIFLKLQQYSYILFCAASCLVLISFRFLISYFGGNPVIHSPLSGTYLMVFGTLFGVNDLVLKFSYYFAFTLFGFFLFHNINGLFDRPFRSLLITSSLMTIPAFFFLGMTVEPALWSVICYSIVMIFLSSKNFKNYRFLVYLVLFFAFFRLASVFALLPIFFHFLLNNNVRIHRLKDIKNLLFIFLPLLSFIPFFLFSLLEGSAATADSNYSFNRFFSLFSNGEIFYLYANVIAPSFLFFAIFLLFINYKSSFTYINLMFFLFLSYVFFSINEELWSFSKYRIEAFVPLLISQTVLTLRNFKNYFLGSFSLFFFAMILMFNLSTVYTFESKCIKNSAYLSYESLKYETKYGCNLISSVPFKFHEPLKIVQDRKSLGSTFIPGVHYGVFTHVLQGINLEGFIKSKTIWDKHEAFMNKNYQDLNFSTNVNYINSNEEIDFVLLGFVKDLPSTRSGLISLGWKEIYSSTEDVGVTVHLLERNK